VAYQDGRAVNVDDDGRDWHLVGNLATRRTQTNGNDNDNSDDGDDDDEGRINFSVALSPKTTRTRNNKLKQWFL